MKTTIPTLPFASRALKVFFQSRQLNQHIIIICIVLENYKYEGTAIWSYNIGAGNCGP